ncbi:uncharacterized protein Bfra_004140 [Botrytis fragariae]|uniref:Uncharacterized protein n=1 Tax=Botrytis fragariae TaxID=1964551 RepID=A0A8H6AUN0_9HELO|nr:uncharacterized protein Bfra_004140 [Botrytis fragariae]KAF5874133.1 hypothetical protein Bfra_004140 [Botrytis fragariae]
MTSAGFNGKPDRQKLIHGSTKDEDKILWEECMKFAVDGIPGDLNEEEFRKVVAAFNQKQRRHQRDDTWPTRSVGSVPIVQRRYYKLRAIANAHGGDPFWEDYNGYKPSRIPIIPGTERGVSMDINEGDNQYDNSFEESMDPRNFPMNPPVDAPFAKTYSEEQYQQGDR